MNKLTWKGRVLLGKVRYLLYCKTDRYYKNTYAKKPLASAEAGNDQLKAMIIAGKPFAAVRFGFNELTALMHSEGQKLGFEQDTPGINRSLCECAGFFPDTGEAYARFYQWHTANMKEIDLLAVWFNAMEDYMIEQYMPDAKLAYFTCLEPYYYEHPWSAALKDKKVLVISPFAKTIEAQYQKHKLLFANPEVLPDFTLETIQAVQTMGDLDGGFADWFAALDSMTEQMRQKDFDIAIIGCGAYGMPLAIEAKKMGKQAVHMGGATQILFGVKGKRWEDDNGFIKSLFNNEWTRPAQSEKPDCANEVEDGCYW